MNAVVENSQISEELAKKVEKSIKMKIVKLLFLNPEEDVDLIEVHSDAILNRVIKIMDWETDLIVIRWIINEQVTLELDAEDEDISIQKWRTMVSVIEEIQLANLEDTIAFHDEVTKNDGVVPDWLEKPRPLKKPVKKKVARKKGYPINDRAKQVANSTRNKRKTLDKLELVELHWKALSHLKENKIFNRLDLFAPDKEAYRKWNYWVFWGFWYLVNIINKETDNLTNIRINQAADILKMPSMKFEILKALNDFWIDSQEKMRKYSADSFWEEVIYEWLRWKDLVKYFYALKNVTKLTESRFYDFINNVWLEWEDYSNKGAAEKLEEDRLERKKNTTKKRPVKAFSVNNLDKDKLNTKALDLLKSKWVERRLDLFAPEMEEYKEWNFWFFWSFPIFLNAVCNDKKVVSKVKINDMADNLEFPSFLDDIKELFIKEWIIYKDDIFKYSALAFSNKNFYKWLTWKDLVKLFYWIRHLKTLTEQTFIQFATDLWLEYKDNINSNPTEWSVEKDDDIKWENLSTKSKLDLKSDNPNKPNLDEPITELVKSTETLAVWIVDLDEQSKILITQVLAALAENPEIKNWWEIVISNEIWIPNTDLIISIDSANISIWTINWQKHSSQTTTESDNLRKTNYQVEQEKPELNEFDTIVQQGVISELANAWVNSTLDLYLISKKAILGEFWKYKNFAELYNHLTWENIAKHSIRNNDREYKKIVAEKLWWPTINSETIKLLNHNWLYCKSDLNDLRTTFWNKKLSNKSNNTITWRSVLLMVLWRTASKNIIKDINDLSMTLWLPFLKEVEAWITATAALEELNKIIMSQEDIDIHADKYIGYLNIYLAEAIDNAWFTGLLSWARLEKDNFDIIVDTYWIHFKIKPESKESPIFTQFLKLIEEKTFYEYTTEFNKKYKDAKNPIKTHLYI